MKVIFLDGKEMTSKKEMYAHISRLFDFPDYFGNNLDALYDCLTEVKDCYVFLTNKAYMDEYLGDYSEKVVKTFMDAVNYSNSFKFIII